MQLSEQDRLLKSREYTRIWQKNNPEKVLQRKREWMKNPVNRMKHTLNQAKRRAKEKGIEFSLSIEDLLPFPEYCPILDIKLNYSGSNKQGFINDSASIDRVDSSKGYTKDNVMIVSWRANRIKADSTLVELKKLVKYMEHQNAII